MTEFSAQDLAGLGKKAEGVAGFGMESHIVKGMMDGDGQILAHYELDKASQERAISRVAAQPEDKLDEVGHQSFSGTSTTMLGNAAVNRRAGDKLASFANTFGRLDARAGFRSRFASLKKLTPLQERQNAARRKELENHPAQVTEKVGSEKLSLNEQEKEVLRRLQNGQIIPSHFAISSPLEVARKAAHTVGTGLRHAYDKWGAALFPGSSPEHIMHLRRK